MVMISKINDAIFVGDSNRVVCLLEDGHIRCVDLEKMDIETIVQVSSRSLNHIEELSNSMYAVACMDGSIYNFDLNYFVAAHKVVAHVEEITHMKAVKSRVNTYINSNC